MFRAYLTKKWGTYVLRGQGGVSQSSNKKSPGKILLREMNETLNKITQRFSDHRPTTFKRGGSLATARASSLGDALHALKKQAFACY